MGNGSERTEKLSTFFLPEIYRDFDLIYSGLKSQRYWNTWGQANLTPMQLCLNFCDTYLRQIKAKVQINIFPLYIEMGWCDMIKKQSNNKVGNRHLTTVMDCRGSTNSENSDNETQPWCLVIFYDKTKIFPQYMKKGWCDTKKKNSKQVGTETFGLWRYEK